ncbi:scale keratin-like [Meleagris gallopavo]|uniref:scale keratin-like n=1 Tax=Meleagris gallopavo TaxID=9103 RepID=UPI00093A3041|nr:scale keratin-like [Meleagris gallopavo]
MSCYDLCPTNIGGISRPQPIADSGNEPCIRQCPDSTAVIQPPAVVVTFPGPILSSFPQDSVVGSSGAPVLGGSSLGYGRSSLASLHFDPVYYQQLRALCLLLLILNNSYFFKGTAIIPFSLGQKGHKKESQLLGMSEQ